MCTVHSLFIQYVVVVPFFSLSLFDIAVVFGIAQNTFQKWPIQLKIRWNFRVHIVSFVKYFCFQVVNITKYEHLVSSLQK